MTFALTGLSGCSVRRGQRVCMEAGCPRERCWGLSSWWQRGGVDAKDLECPTYTADGGGGTETKLGFLDWHSWVGQGGACPVRTWRETENPGVGSGVGDV